MILVYFPSGECVDDVVNNQINHQFTSIIVGHFMNSSRVCWITSVRVCTPVQTTVGDMNTTNLKGVMKNQNIKRSFFKI